MSTKSTAPMKTFDDWWRSYLLDQEYGPHEEGLENLSKEELQALNDKKEEYRAIYESGREQGMRMVPEITNSTLRLPRYTTTLLEIYSERDRLRKQVSQLAGSLREAELINGKFHEILDVVEKFNKLWAPDDER